MLGLMEADGCFQLVYPRNYDATATPKRTDGVAYGNPLMEPFEVHAQEPAPVTQEPTPAPALPAHRPPPPLGPAPPPVRLSAEAYEERLKALTATLTRVAQDPDGGIEVGVGQEVTLPGGVVALLAVDFHDDATTVSRRLSANGSSLLARHHESEKDTLHFDGRLVFTEQNVTRATSPEAEAWANGLLAHLGLPPGKASFAEFVETVLIDEDSETEADHLLCELFSEK